MAAIVRFPRDARANPGDLGAGVTQAVYCFRVAPLPLPDQAQADACPDSPELAEVRHPASCMGPCHRQTGLAYEYQQLLGERGAWSLFHGVAGATQACPYAASHNSCHIDTKLKSLLGCAMHKHAPCILADAMLHDSLLHPRTYDVLSCMNSAFAVCCRLSRRRRPRKMRCSTTSSSGRRRWTRAMARSR